MFGGLTHEPAVRLAKRLVDMSPEGLEHVFLADSGSVSVEVAVKMCLQHWRSLGRPGKQRLLTWRGGYHGDTWQPMSVCDPEGGMHELWQGVLPRQVFADAPPAAYEESYADQLRELIERHADELAAVIVEPVVQGAGGMRFHSPAYLRVLREACDAHDVLLVFDEIATGFGRTGTLFAAEHAGGDARRDVRRQGADRRLYDDGGDAVHGAGRRRDLAGRGAGARARARPSWATRSPPPWPAPRSTCCSGRTGRPRSSGSRRGCGRGSAPAAELPGVRDVRVLGAIGVVQLDHEVDMAAATRAAVREGVWLRPFRDLVYTMPPYVTGDEDLARITARGVRGGAGGLTCMRYW